MKVPLVFGVRKLPATLSAAWASALTPGWNFDCRVRHVDLLIVAALCTGSACVKSSELSIRTHLALVPGVSGIAVRDNPKDCHDVRSHADQSGL